MEKNNESQERIEATENMSFQKINGLSLEEIMEIIDADQKQIGK